MLCVDDVQDVYKVKKGKDAIGKKVVVV